MQDKDTFCISRNNAIVALLVVILVTLAIVANFVSSQRLSDRSRASATDLEALPLSTYDDKVKGLTSTCDGVKGYLARTVVDTKSGVMFDRFNGHYYSLDKRNPVVTPMPGKPDTGYCGVTGNLVPNWCVGITTETACRADCTWVVKGACAKCAPLGVDPTLICQP